MSIAPARIPPALAGEAAALASRVATELEYVGVLALESRNPPERMLWTQHTPVKTARASAR